MYRSSNQWAESSENKLHEQNDFMYITLKISVPLWAAPCQARQARGTARARPAKVLKSKGTPRHAQGPLSIGTGTPNHMTGVPGRARHMARIWHAQVNHCARPDGANCWIVFNRGISTQLEAAKPPQSGPRELHVRRHDFSNIIRLFEYE